MTRQEFYDRLRVLLHDYGLEYMTPQPSWDNSEIEIKALAARDVIYTELVDSGSIVTVNRMLSIVIARAGTAVPTDFFRLALGFGIDDRWILPHGTRLGEAIEPSGRDTVFVRAGTFQGTADTALIYRRPTSNMRPGGTPFTDFPDAFYEAVLLLTAYDLVLDDPDGQDRAEELRAMLDEQMATLE